MTAVLRTLPRSRRAGIQVPEVFGDDVGGEEVDLGEGVVFFLVVVGFELAEVSGAGAGGGGFDLDAEEVGTVFDADVVGAGVSPGFGHFESMLHGGGHEAEFDPFAALFEISEELLVYVHDAGCVDLRPFSPDKSAKKHERRDRWAAPFNEKQVICSLYSEYQIGGGPTGKESRLYIWNAFIELRGIV